MDKKYTSLEHSIRNIMTESIGAIGTDKFTKTGNSFFRSFHAEPKKGDTHPNGNSIRAARNVSNQRGSGTMNEYENLLEYSGVKAKTGEAIGDIFTDVTKKIKREKALVPPTEAPTVPSPKTKPIEVPTVEPEVQPKPKTKPIEVPTVNPEVPTVEPEVQPKPKKEPFNKPIPRETPITEPGISSIPSTKPGGIEKPTGKTSPNSNSNPRQPEKNKRKIEKERNIKRDMGWPIISFPLAQNPVMGIFGGAPVKTYLHSPQERLGESNDTADKIRSSIENVARPNSKNKLTKQAEIKAKIIESNNRKVEIVKNALEDKKKTTIIKNPKLKHLEIDEAAVRKPDTTPNPKTYLGKADAFVRSAANELTFGGMPYVAAAGDYAIKNTLGKLTGLSKGTTFSKELKQEQEKDVKANRDYEQETNLGAVAPYVLGGAGLAKAGVKQAVRFGASPSNLNKAVIFGKKLVPGTLETYFTKTGIEDTSQSLKSGDYKQASIDALGTAPILGTAARLVSKTPKTLARAEKLDTALNLAGVTPVVAGAAPGAAELGKMAIENPSLIKPIASEIPGAVSRYAKEKYKDVSNYLFPKPKK